MSDQMGPNNKKSHPMSMSLGEGYITHAQDLEEKLKWVEKERDFLKQELIMTIWGAGCSSKAEIEKYIGDKLTELSKIDPKTTKNSTTVAFDFNEETGNLKVKRS